MNEQLKEFYKAYSDWLHCGAIEGQPFTRNAGLCGALVRYGWEVDWSFHQRISAAAVMREQFDRAGLSLQYPFNTGKYDFSNEIRKGEAHLNNERIMWVRKGGVLHYV